MLYLETRKTKAKKTGEVTLTYYIRGKCPYTGELVRQGTKARSREQARDLLAIFEARQRNKAMLGDASVATFSEVAVVYLRNGGSERFLEPLLDEFGTKKMSEITDAMLARFAEKQYPDCQPSTIVRQAYGPFEAVWNAGVEAKPPLCNPRVFNKPKVRKTKPKYAKTDDHLLKIVKAIKSLGGRAGVLFMSFSGARASEVVNVLCEDFDPEAGTITLQHTKNDDARVVKLPPFVLEACKLLDLTDPKTKLFGMESRYTLYKMVKRAAKKAGVEFLSPHKLGRHTFAFRFLKDGNSLPALQMGGGWRSISAVSRYAHLEKQAVSDAVAGVTTNRAQELGDAAIGSAADERRVEEELRKHIDGDGNADEVDDAA